MCLKKFCIIALSVGISLIIFLVIAFLCITPMLFNNNELNNTKSQTDKAGVLSVATVFLDGQRFFLGKLDLDCATGSATTTPINLENENISPFEYIEKYGKYAFYRLCCEKCGKNVEKYIVLDGKNFTKIADRSKAIVYNDILGITVSLTGKQADLLLNQENFLLFCAQIAENGFKTGFIDFFNQIADTTENNLSYPAFYNKTKE